MSIGKITLLQHQNNVILSILDQRWNSTLNQRWLWIDNKKIVFMLWYQRNCNLYINIENNCIALSKQHHFINVKITTKFNVDLGWFNLTIILGWHWNQFCSYVILNGCKTSNRCRNYVDNWISTSVHVISTCFFDAILMDNKSTSFRCTFLM